MLGPLSWVLIYVTDVAKTRHFYETVLGLPVKRSSSSEDDLRNRQLHAGIDKSAR